MSIDVYLNPGDFHFYRKSLRDTADKVRIRTLLGSCVSIILWHPERKIGGMCHFMLPTRTHKSNQPLDGRYADEVMQLLMLEIQRSNSTPGEYRAWMAGGGNMFNKTGAAANEAIGAKNIEMGKRLLKQYGFTLRRDHTGGEGYRKLVFDLDQGRVEVLYENQTIIFN